MSDDLQIRESELEEVFTRASGPGGQNVNKVSTRVTLRHIPTGISVTVQDSRSQAQNRQLARERLLKALRARRSEAESRMRKEQERIRRQNAQRPAGVKRRMVESKRFRSKLKQQRHSVDD
jgi:protein subunit release factor B